MAIVSASSVHFWLFLSLSLFGGKCAGYSPHSVGPKSRPSRRRAPTNGRQVKQACVTSRWSRKNRAFPAWRTVRHRTRSDASSDCPEEEGNEFCTGLNTPAEVTVNTAKGAIARNGLATHSGSHRVRNDISTSSESVNVKNVPLQNTGDDPTAPLDKLSSGRGVDVERKSAPRESAHLKLRDLHGTSSQGGRDTSTILPVEANVLSGVSADSEAELTQIESQPTEAREVGVLPPGPVGTVWLLQYTSGVNGNRYASLGNDMGKFVTFLDDVAAHRIHSDSDQGRSSRSQVLTANETETSEQERVTVSASGSVALAIAACGGKWAAGLSASIVNATAEDVLADIQKLWNEGRLLSQDRDGVNALRGGEQSFAELLISYTARTKANHWENIARDRLLEFLQQHDLEISPRYFFDIERPANETLSLLGDLVRWFRQKFPYFYDACRSCGNTDNNSFIGYVYPTEDERLFKAGRTELYRCSACCAVTRFARYAAVSKVLETRRGRCGEYSVLMLRFLEALGYSCRWVVDWSDHVWTEAKVGDRWVHVDPCEAAVDEPLLYESWGKNQTYILAFTPEEVVDVTHAYTSDFEASKARREFDEEKMRELLANATRALRA